MCVIIYRPAGVPIAQEILEAAAKQNTDGVGVMWPDTERNHLNIRRNVDSNKIDMLYYGSKNLKAVPEDVDCAIHFRFATHGEVSKRNCHPYKVYQDIYIMHNGVLPVCDANKILSDTGVYAKLVMRPVLQQAPHLYWDPGFRQMVRMSAGQGNKFLFMRGNGDVWIVNRDLGKERDGLWLSTDPLSRTYTATRTNYTTGGTSSSTAPYSSAAKSTTSSETTKDTSEKGDDKYVSWPSSTDSSRTVHQDTGLITVKAFDSLSKEDQDIIVQWWLDQGYNEMAAAARSGLFNDKVKAVDFSPEASSLALVPVNTSTGAD